MTILKEVKKKNLRWTSSVSTTNIRMSLMYRASSGLYVSLGLTFFGGERSSVYPCLHITLSELRGMWLR